jgi:ComF family protein
MMIGGRTVRAFIAALFPTRCLACGSFFQPDGGIRLDDSKNGIQNTPLSIDESYRDNRLSVQAREPISFHGLMAPFVCPQCLEGLMPATSPLCVQCGAVFESREGDDHLCGSCLAMPKQFRIARAFGVHDRTLMALVHRFKYDGKIQLTKPLGKLLFAVYLHHWKRDDIDLIIPVPLHIKRFRKRGFNQSYLMVREWSKMKSKTPPVERDVLVRIRWTDSQTGLGRKHRTTNIKGAFCVSDPSQIAGKTILLVDDVYTTGATVDECTKVLRSAGAQQVDVLTLARAL